MSEVPKIIEDFLKGNNDAGGTVAKLEEEASRLVSQIESLETTNHRLRTENDNEYDAALEWAASWITGAQLLGRSEEIKEYARNMAMSIRAAKRGLTPRALDAADVCRVINHFYVEGVCSQCGSIEPPRQ